MVQVGRSPSRIRRIVSQSISLPPPVTPATTPPTFKANIDGTWTIELQDSGNSPTNFNAFGLFGSSHDQNSPFFSIRTPLIRP